MKPFLIVEPDVVVDLGSCVPRRGRVVEIHLLIFDCSKKTFRDHVIESSSFPVHADENALFLKTLNREITREMASRIAVPHDGSCPKERFFYGTHDKPQFQALIKFPADEIAGGPVNDDDQIHPSSTKPDIANIDAPNLVGDQNRPVPEKAGKDPVLLVPPGKIGARMDSFDSPLSHVSLEGFSGNSLPFPA